MDRSRFGTILLFSLLVPVILRAQSVPVLTMDEPSRGEIRIMWYNAENLFHPSDDSLGSDDEFTPEGQRHWTYARYRQKLTSIARVIIAAGQWDPPDLVGFAEVEQARVLEDLVAHPILEPYHYRYLHRESPDHRGMDVACLYRVKRFKPAGWETFPPVVSVTLDSTREMVHIWGSWARKDSLDLFLVHFISRYRGSGATAEYRKMQSARLAHLADSVCRARPGSLVVLAGDFNETWEGFSLEPLRSVPVGKDTATHVRFMDSGASYKYRGTWSGIDHFFIAGRRERYRISGSVFRLPVLFASDETYGGVKPFRTYEGYRYAGGISDHLPILLDISRSLSSAHSGH